MGLRSITGTALVAGTGHPTKVIVVKVDVDLANPFEILDQGQAAPSGQFTLKWSDWDGRVALGIVDEDAAVKLDCVWADFYQSADVSDRYDHLIAQTSPVCCIPLNEASGVYKCLVEPTLELTTISTGTAPTARRGAFENFTGLYGPTFDGIDQGLEAVDPLTAQHLRLMGDMTGTLVFKTPIAWNGSERLVSFWGVAGGSESEADNPCWSMSVHDGGDVYIFWESGAGVNSGGRLVAGLALDTEYVITFTRTITGKLLKLYIDTPYDRLPVIDTTYLTDPTGATNNQLVFGMTNAALGNAYPGQIGALVIHDYVLTDDQVYGLHATLKNDAYGQIITNPGIKEYFPLDEESGTVIYDHSPELEHGTREVSCKVQTTRPWGHHQPKGQDFTKDEACSSGGSQISVAAGWNITNVVMGGLVRFDSVALAPSGEYATLFAWARDRSQYSMFCHLDPDGHLYYGFARNYTRYIKGPKVREGAWYYIQIYFRYNGVAEFWVNGVLHGTDVHPNGGLYQQSGYLWKMYLGEWYSSVYGDFDGQMSNVYITTLGTEEVNDDYFIKMNHAMFNTDRVDEYVTDLLLTHNMETIDGTTLLDAEGNVDGVINGTVPQVVGAFGQALSFDGVAANFVNLGDMHPAAALTAMTVCGFFKADSGGSGGTLLAKYNAGGNERVWQCRIESNGFPSFGVWPAGTVDATRIATDSLLDTRDGKWHFYAARFVENVSIEVSCDGGPWQVAAAPGTMFVASLDVILGSNGDTPRSTFGGDMDSWRVYDSYKTEDELAYIRSQDSATFPY